MVGSSKSQSIACIDIIIVTTHSKNDSLIQPLVSLVFHNLPSLYPFLYLYNILLIAFLMPHCPVTVVQRYRDGVCSLLFHLFFIFCHRYIPLHLKEMTCFTDFCLCRRGDQTQTAPLRRYATNLYTGSHKPHIVHTTSL